jgi:hypothetical protein
MRELASAGTLLKRHQTHLLAIDVGRHIAAGSLVVIKKKGWGKGNRGWIGI